MKEEKKNGVVTGKGRVAGGEVGLREVCFYFIYSFSFWPHCTACRS